MADIITENWKVFPGLLLGAFVVGLIAMVFIRDGMRKWLLNGDGHQSCPVQAKGDTPLSEEDHEVFCTKKWAEHDRISTERWVHNQEMAKKDREHIISEFEHLKVAVDRIFEKLDRR